MNQRETLVYDGFHKIIQLETEMKGQPVFREKLLINSAVAGVVTDEEGKIALVTQYRPTIGKYTKEIPAGLLDKPELSAKETLIEELMEECAVSPKEILHMVDEPIHRYHMMGGSSDATLSIYRLKVKKQENKKIDDVDVDEVNWVTLEEMKTLIEEGTISDGKTIIAYYILLSESK